MGQAAKIKVEENLKEAVREAVEQVHKEAIERLVKENEKLKAEINDMEQEISFLLLEPKNDGNEK